MHKPSTKPHLFPFSILLFVQIILSSFSLPSFAPAQIPQTQPLSPTHLIVFAAASLTNTLTQLSTQFEEGRNHEVKVVLHFASSGTLARQILSGAPADMVISANQTWMDELQNHNAIIPATRAILVLNHLVLIRPKNQPAITIDWASGPIPLPLQTGRWAIGDPAHVPAGQYARQAFEKLSWWNAIEPRTIAASDVRATLRYIEIDEADWGIVFLTDARTSDQITLVSQIPSHLHDPIQYSLALCPNASPIATDFARFLQSPQAQSRWLQDGFSLPAPSLVPPPTTTPAH